MIRVFTDHALARRTRKQRRDFAAELAKAIEETALAACSHNIRPSCPKCQSRQAAFAAAKLVRDTGGVW